MALDKSKLPAMYRRLYEVMKGNGIHESKELDNQLAMQKVSRTYRLTKEDMFKIKRELKDFESTK